MVLVALVFVGLVCRGSPTRYFCWSGSAAGYCDDSLELVSYRSSLSDCKAACVLAANNTGQGTVGGCTGVAFAATGYCYTYDATAGVQECDRWYAEQEAAITGIDSYFIQECEKTWQQE